MIYKKKEQEIYLYLSQKVVTDKDKEPVRFKIKKLTEYVLIMHQTIKDRNLIFNRESGQSIPKSNLTIESDIRCKACFSWNMDDSRIKFKRINKYERRRETKYGHECKACGYLNTES